MTAVAAVRLHPSTGTWAVIGRWMASTLGFPLGGLLAISAVGSVDSTATALAAGAITGLVLGGAQGVASTSLPRVAWTLATSLGLAVGLGVGATVVGFDTSIWSLVVQGAISGLSVGFAQMLVVRRMLPTSIAFAWAPYLGACWALGWAITSTAGVDVDRQYAVFGATGAIAVTALTSWLPIVMRRR